MKSAEVRNRWRDVLEHVRAGGTIVVEHYDRPVARIVPISSGVATWSAEELLAELDNLLHPENTIRTAVHVTVAAVQEMDDKGQAPERMTELAGLLRRAVDVADALALVRHDKPDYRRPQA